MTIGATMRRAARLYYANPTFILMLIPMFLIISSSVYPAIESTIQNKEILIIAEAIAQIEEDNQMNRGTYTSSHHDRLTISGSHTPSSPTPIDPSTVTNNSSHAHSLSSSSPSSPIPAHSNKTPIIEDQPEDEITATAINAGDLVHVLWADNTPGNFDIFYKRDGTDFDPITINLSNNAGVSASPAIAVSGNNVHVVWNDQTSGNEILYIRSTNGGGTFGPTINLSNNAGFSQAPMITVLGNNVHVVWQDNTPGNLDIFYKRSTDGGASFVEPTKNLSSNAGLSVFPAIAVSGNNVHVVWRDDTPGNNDILYRRSVNGGSTFPNIIKNLSFNAGNSERPAIAAIGNNVHVVWDDITSGNSDILYRRSINGGETFPNIIINLSTNAEGSFAPAIAAIGNNVHVVWQDETPGNFDIFYRRSTDGGASFTESIKNLSGTAGLSNLAEIALSGNNVYVVWREETLGIEIVYRTSSNNGSTFPDIISNLSGNTGISESPAIAVS